ncbi:MAG TPA: hypothetical protein VN259_00500 [Xanthomonadales bacterium]|nr:hypothetical protein [Xanthomonadales bacterium]
MSLKSLPATAIACALVALLAPLSSPLSAADFAGGGAVIPDNLPAGANINFSVSGIAGSVGRVRIGINMTHSFIGDLRATLISPGGTARLVLFSRAGIKGAGAFGSSANLAGNYIFDDSANSDLWATIAPLATSATVAPASYRSSTGGSVGLSSQGGCSTYLSLAFGGLSGAQVNGTWTLNIADLAGGDTGSVTSTLLTIDPATQLFASGFEDAGPGPVASSVRGSCDKAHFDYAGTGLSSYVLVRNTGGGSGGAITWFIKDNDGSVGGAERNFLHGVSTDTFVDGDFDGDGIADATAWRPSLGAYLVRRSSRPGDSVLTIPLGQSGDGATHIGDYDGDGISDPAVYRAGASAGLPSSMLIRLSSTGQVRTLATGENGAFASGGADLNGDGRADVLIQSNAGGGVARFRFFDGTSGAQFADVNFGTPTDVIITGNHFGSTLADITVVRGVAGVLNWTTRDTATGVGQPTVAFGASATDFPLSGDFDGDGRDDYAVWRPNATPGLSKFVVRRSSSPAVPLELPFGQNGDYPVANSRSN